MIRLIDMILFETVKALKEKTPFGYLALTMMAVAFSFTGWTILSTNFAINAAKMDGLEWGWAHSIREIPGFLAFTTVYLLLVLSEQRLAAFSVFLLGVGIALTGYFPTGSGFFITTFVMSVGFHYYYTVFLSLPMQMFEADDYPIIRSKLRSIDSAVAAISFLLVLAFVYWLEVNFKILFLLFGLAAIIISLYCLFAYKPFKLKHAQQMKIILRKRYCLYYLLQFLSGARRQIFVVFAALLLVEKFDYSVLEIAGLFFANHLITTIAAPYIGRFVLGFGERFVLQIEYLGLIIVFTLYAFVDVSWLAALLYIIDNIFFSLAIALESYFKRIADKTEIAASAGVVFTINHIAAVFLPALLGAVWLFDHSLVFYLGAGLACLSFLATCLIPRYPNQGNETQSFSLALKVK